MSIVSNVHNITAYVPTVTKAFTGQRLSVIYWKTGKDGVKKESKCVSIPKVTGVTPDELQAMIPQVLELITTTQNKIIRELVDAGKSFVSDEDISVAKCIAYMQEVGTSENSVRLTKDTLGEWFNSKLADSLTLLLADKFGIGDTMSAEQEMMLTATVNAFKSKIVGIANPNTKYAEKEVGSIKNAIAASNDSEDPIVGKLVERLDKMLIKVEEINLIDVL
jgi:hypothetical protein